MNTPIKKQEETATESEFTNKYYARVVHDGRPQDHVVQKIVNYAYKLGGYDFLAVLECENGSYKLDAVGDKGHAFWLCQVNNLYHKDIPADYTKNRVVAVEYCYQKWKAGTRFYWPTRLVKGQKCYEYVKDRFTFTE